MSATSTSPAASWQKQVICRYFAVGSCQKGESCSYSHDPELISQSSLAQVPNFGGEVFFTAEYAHDQDEFVTDGDVVEVEGGGYLGDQEAALQQQDGVQQFVDAYSATEFQGEVIEGDYSVGEGDYGDVGIEVYSEAVEGEDGSQDQEDDEEGEEDGDQVNPCFDASSCHIQGVTVDALTVGVNTMSLDPCSDPNCLDNSQLLQESQDFGTGGPGYPTSPAYIVYTPVYPSPPALSPGAVPLVSPPLPLVSPPLAPLVSPAPSSSGGGSGLSPTGSGILSPGVGPAATILQQPSVLPAPGTAATLLQQTSPGGPHQTMISVHVHPTVAQVMSQQATAGGQVVPHHPVTACQVVATQQQQQQVVFQHSVPVSQPRAAVNCQQSTVGSCQADSSQRVSCSPQQQQQQQAAVTCLQNSNTAGCQATVSSSCQHGSVSTSHHSTNNLPSCLSVATSLSSSPQNPNQTVINKGCSLVHESTLNPNTAEFSPCRPSVPEFFCSEQHHQLSDQQQQLSEQQQQLSDQQQQLSDQQQLSESHQPTEPHLSSPECHQQTNNFRSSWTGEREGSDQRTTSITSKSCTSQNKGSPGGQVTWKAPSNWVDAPEFVPKPSFAPSHASAPEFVPKLAPHHRNHHHQHQRRSGGGSHQVQHHCGAPQYESPGGLQQQHQQQPQQQPQQQQQQKPQQRSWAQVVNSNIVKQQGSSMTVAEAESELCPYFRSGECRYGNICMYIHGNMCDYCGQNVLHPHHENQRKAHLGECLREHERDMELSFAVARSKEKTCGICMEIVLDKPKGEARFGILPSCNHCFCLPCIRKWRQAKQFEHKIIRACPECRQTSDFICPSRFWVETTEQKDQLLAEYKKNLGLKECKYFNKGSGECPFGNKCFYQHADKDGRIIDVGPPRKPQRRVNADGNLSLVQRLLLYDFLEEREGQLVLPLDFVELFDLYSDSDDWSENEP